MLLLLVPGAVPRVVGEIDHGMRTALAVVPHGLPDDPGQDVLVADEGREPVAGGAQRLRGGARRQMGSERRPLVEKREPVAEGDVLAEGEELDLVVMVADLPLRREDDG